jgi:hypothetical protein
MSGPWPGGDPRGMTHTPRPASKIHAVGDNPGPPTGRLSKATVTWGVVFAVAHFYWAFGGDEGLPHARTSGIAGDLYIAFIAVIGLVAAAIARGLGAPRGARYGVRRLRRVALAGGVALALGVVVGVIGWIADGTLDDDGVEGVIITAYFLLGAGLFIALGTGRSLAHR